MGYRCQLPARNVRSQIYHSYSLPQLSHCYFCFLNLTESCPMMTVVGDHASGCNYPKRLSLL